MEFDYWILNFLFFRGTLVFIWWFLVLAIFEYKEWDATLAFILLLVGTPFILFGPIGLP